MRAIEGMLPLPSHLFDHSDQSARVLPLAPVHPHNVALQLRSPRWMSGSKREPSLAPAWLGTVARRRLQIGYRWSGISIYSERTPDYTYVILSI